MTAAGERPAGNLPVTVTRFVGRRRELAEVRRLIAQSRLVTLTGVGGVGKTRLATEAAAWVGSAFPGGTWMADLSAVVDGGQAAQAVANALGVVDRSTRPATDKIIGHFAGAVALLVLDNCEHLDDACAVLVDRLLSETRDIRVLATSRRPLGLTGEHLFPVPPLSVPEPGDGTDPAGPDCLSRFDAVTLLADEHVPSVAYEAVADHFSADEIAALVSLIVAINAWNQIAVSTRAWLPGSYEP